MKGQRWTLREAVLSGLLAVSAWLLGMAVVATTVAWYLSQPVEGWRWD